MLKTLIFIFLIIQLNIAGQGFRSRVYISKGTNHCTKDVFEISNGNYFGLGISIDTLKNKVRYPLSVVILDNQGKTLIIKNYLKNKTNFSNAPITIRTSCKVGNNIYFAGTVFDSTAKFTGVLIKFNFNGDTLWSKNFVDINCDLQIHKVSPSADGGFFLIGNLLDNVHGIMPTILIKTDANGNELWRKLIHKSNPDGSETKSVLQDTLSKKIVLGGTQNFGSGLFYSDIMVLDSLGNIISRNYFQQGGVQDVIQTKDKGIVVVGFEEISGHQNTGRSFALKFNINSPNQPLWRIDNFGPITLYNTFNNVSEFPNTNLLIAGVIDSTGLTNGIYTCLIRYVEVNSNGQILNTRFYNYAPDLKNDYSQYLYSTCITSDGGWISTNSPNNAGNNPMIFVKYDANGCDSTLAYCANKLGTYELEVGDLEIKLWPNPATSEINIESEILDESEIEISNALGQVIFSKKINSKKEQIEIADEPKGIYFVNVKNKKVQRTIRLIKT